MYAALKVSWVVNAPAQLLVPPPSVIVPNAVRPSAVDTPPSFVRMNGEPAAIEHEAPGAKPVQFVFDEPGPSPVRTKSSEVPRIVMKSFTDPPPVVRFRILPVAPASTVPPEYVKSVLIPVLKQPAVPPSVGGVQTMLVAEKVIPPPAQFVSVRVPKGSANAGVLDA